MDLTSKKSILYHNILLNLTIRVIGVYKKKVSVMSRTGNSGPPETPQDISLR